ncbi:unnamed protein product [Durusdinium trenchii]|uniref:Integrase catalytic domain-containing protein n=1 Tax=Durusdinium trenchii TaxID=1381693 RepID=A0ABP0K777_9DINO
MLWYMNDFVKDTLSKAPDTKIYFEWTHPCQGWQEPPMVDLETFLAALDIPWLSCRIDGCVYGMMDSRGEHHLHKKWLVKTTCEHFHATYKTKVCHGGHSHTLIQGAETAKSAYYPWKLVQSWARFWRAEMVSDRNLRLLFMKQDSPAALENEELYLLADDDGGTLNALPAEEALQPVEVPSEQEKKQWMARVAHFHKAAGHPTNKNLAKLIKNAGQPAWKSELALEHKCPACEAIRPGGTSSKNIPPASTHSMWSAWQAVGMDTAEWQIPATKNKVKFVLMMDLATKLRVVWPIMEYPNMEMRAETADHIIEAFTERWLSVFPKPEMVIVDNGKSFTSDRFNTFLRESNIAVHYPPEKEPWAHGILEAGIQDIKQVATVLHMEQLDLRPAHTLVLATSALNQTEYTAGYSAQQWAFGKHYSLTDEDHRTYEQVEPSTDFARLVQARQQAEEIAVKTRSKRVLSKLSNTLVRQPLRTFSPMQLVKIWRQFQPADQHKGSPTGKSTLQPSDYKLKHRSSPLGLQPPDREVQHFVPPAHASSSARPSNSALPEAEETANDYEDYTPSLPDAAADEPPEDEPQPSERDPKRARSEYDLKWVEELKSHSEIDNNEVFSYLTECQDDLDVLVMHIDVEPETNTEKKGKAIIVDTAGERSWRSWEAMPPPTSLTDHRRRPRVVQPPKEEESTRRAVRRIPLAAGPWSHFGSSAARLTERFRFSSSRAKEEEALEFACCCAASTGPEETFEANYQAFASDECLSAYLAKTGSTSSSGPSRQAEKSRLQALLKDFAKSATNAGCPCVYFKEGTWERADRALYRMDNLLQTLMLISGQGPQQLEVTCPITAIEDIYCMAEDGPSYFPPEVVAALTPEEKEQLLMIVFSDADAKFVRLCLAQESRQSRDDFLECMRILSVYAQSQTDSKVKPEP